MTSPSFVMTHIANVDDLRENTEVCDQIDEALGKSLVTQAQYDIMEKNLVEKQNTSRSDTITELIFLSLGQQQRNSITLSISKDYYCTKSYQEVFGEPESQPDQKNDFSRWNFHNEFNNNVL